MARAHGRAVQFDNRPKPVDNRSVVAAVRGESTMLHRWVNRDIVAMLASIVFLALGVLAVWLSNELLDIEGEAVFVALLLLPVVVFMILSGRVRELRGPGGLEAKFVDVAGQSVELVSETIEASVDDMIIVAKGGASELERQAHDLDESKPIILTLNLGREGYYDRSVWSEYMDALSQFRTFRFVVVLDRENKFLAYIPSGVVGQILKTQGVGDDFVSAINDGRIPDLRRFLGVVTRTISVKSTNMDALREMTDQNLEALVVIDDDRNLVGVVEREQILSKLLLAMAR